MDGIVLVHPDDKPWSKLFVLGGLLVVTGLTSYLAWHGETKLIAAVLFLPALWAVAPNRLAAWFVVLTYYLVAARDIPAGAAIFFGEGSVLGWPLLIGASLILSIPYALLWKQSPGFWRFSFALLLVALPPIGIVGWTSPLTVAGLLFPGMGWYGLAAALLMLGLIGRFPMVAIGAFLVALLMPLSGSQAPKGWVGLETSYLMASGGRSGLAAAQRQLDLNNRVSGLSESVIILPETIAGRWSESSLFLWGDLARAAKVKGQTIILGAELHGEAGYRNMALKLTPGGGEPLYQQMMPVPVSMWQPWGEGSAIPAWFTPQSVQIGDRRATFLICYEQLLVWPALVALSTDPDVLVGMSNDWWARGGDIPDIQISALKAWASLFDKNLLYSVNK